VSVHLRELFNPSDLAEAIDAGYVRRQVHPDGSLAILNYTERCQYEGAWNDVTRQCRGLIVNDADGVIARPWAKFFNYGDSMCGPLDLAAPAEVTDKLDGSLGILYPGPDGWMVATRGSFTSDQALHATTVLRMRYDDFDPPDGMTVLFEIVYPENRIVVDYGTTDDLILLGAVDIATGEAVGPDWISGWYGPIAETFGARTLADALVLPPRPNVEGVVVRMVDTGTMVKIKQEDYVALHKIVTGLNARVVWEHLGNGKTVADICEPLPDELHDWVKNLAADLTGQALAILAEAREEHERILASMSGDWTRKDYAAVACRSANRAWLFMLLDGKDPAPKIWRTLRPSGDNRPINISEDVA
jgi:RNA ligase